MTITAQAAIDTIIDGVPGAPLADTVDTVKIGDPGLRWCLPWLQERLPALPIHFVPTGRLWQER